MKIKIGNRVIEARTQQKSTTPSGNGYFVVVYSLDGETIYQHHTGCMAAPPSPVNEFETVKEIWVSCDKDDPKRTHSTETGWGYHRKPTVRELIDESLSQVVD